MQQENNSQLQLFNEADFYHNTSQKGFFALCYKSAKTHKFQQRSYPLDLMADVVRAVDTSRDTYISQGEFWLPNRRIVNLKRLGLNFIDLDVYNTPLRSHSHEQICGLILEHCATSEMPTPSIIMSSGRGLYVKWFLTETVPAAVLPRWIAVQKYLANFLVDFGADKKALDASRVLRLEGTVNTKSKTIARVLYPLYHEPQSYDFEELCLDVLPVSREELRANRKASQYKENDLIAVPKSKFKVITGKGQKGLNRFSPLQLWWDRLGDLRKLAKMRGGVGVAEGTQDLFLFLATTSLSWVVSPGEVAREVEALAREFCPKFTRSEAWAVTGSVRTRANDAARGKKVTFNGQQVDSRYRISNQWIIDKLAIQPDEIALLKTIIDKDEAKKRHRERNLKTRREAGAIDRHTYLKDAHCRRLQVLKMMEQGISRREMADKLGVTQDAVKSLVRQVKKGGVKSLRMYKIDGCNPSASP